MAKPTPWLIPAVWTGGAMPAFALAAQLSQDALGANPVSTALNRLGLLALIFLTLTLACTPAKTLLGWVWPQRIKRQLGLLGFGYVCLHLLMYLGDQGFSLGTMLDDVAKRPFITVGVLAWALLVPLAVTSTDAWVKRLTFVQWKQLHRLSYLCAGLGCLHFFLRVKKDVTEPLAYAAAVGFLLAVRAVAYARKQRRSASA